MMDKPRSFREASLPGRGRGRPASSAKHQFAGSRDNLSNTAKALMASYRWQLKKRSGGENFSSKRRSISSGADISAWRGERREGTRFDSER